MIEVADPGDGGALVILRIGARELTLTVHPRDRLRAVTQIGDERPRARIPETATDLCALMAWLAEGRVADERKETEE